MGSYKVELHIYDLSYGMAKYLSPLIGNKHLLYLIIKYNLELIIISNFWLH